MGILDKAKAAIKDGFGDETVRVVNYDKAEEEVTEEPKLAKPPKAPREPKAPKPPRSTLKKQKPPKPVTPKPPKAVKTRLPKPVAPKPIPEPEPEPELPEGFEDLPADFFIEDDDSDSVFAVQDKDYFKEKQKEYDEDLKIRFKDVPEVKVENNVVQDVLEVLGIQPTFAIERNIFLPEDLKAISFDVQTPYGYEQGQVTAFLNRTRLTVERYVTLLKQRNEDIAKLATIIDRLQVDINNLRYQIEIGHGINVLPTSENDDLETKYLESKLLVRRLEDDLRRMKSGDGLSSSEREKFEHLQDEFSLVNRKKEELEEENYNLRTQLAYLEEANDEIVTTESDLPTVEETDDDEDYVFDDGFNLDPTDEEDSGFSVAESTSDEDFELPILDDELITPEIKQPSANPTFAIEEDDFNPSESSIEVMSGDNQVFDYTDDDDELDAMLAQWNK